jgi:indole-3-glycerol phosphate synthase
MSILDKIVADKRREAQTLRPQADRLRREAHARSDVRDFAGALRSRGAVRLIAELKKASPSAGVIQPQFDPVRIARQYEAAGAAALSVLTDERYFQGHLDDLRQVRAAVGLPVLRKDFIVDEVQVYESVARGADAILLIVAILDAVQLKDFIALARQLGVAALVEVHQELELDRALAAGADILGINNRDLRDFSVDLATTERLARLIHAHATKPIVVAESGIRARADVERVAAAGVDAILVGESLMKGADIAATARELMGPAMNS